MKDLSQFEQKFNLRFTDKALLREAFTHRSYINESKERNIPHNERLEFLGDAVIELVVTDHLFRTYQDRTEGELTSYRSALVNAVTLSQLASRLEMNEYLLLSKGEAKDTGKARQIILANAIEALIGAVYLDQGYAAAEAFLGEHLLPLTERIVEQELWRDAKSAFQEKAQEEAGVTPTYRVLKETGPDHDKKFIVAVFLGEKMIAQAAGKSKQEAEQGAAAEALNQRGWQSTSVSA